MVVPFIPSVKRVDMYKNFLQFKETKFPGCTIDFYRIMVNGPLVGGVFNFDKEIDAYIHMAYCDQIDEHFFLIFRRRVVERKPSQFIGSSYVETIEYTLCNEKSKWFVKLEESPNTTTYDVSIFGT